MRIFKTTLKQWSSEISSISPPKHDENKSKQHVSLVVAKTTIVVPMHAVMVTHGTGLVCPPYFLAFFRVTRNSFWQSRFRNKLPVNFRSFISYRQTISLTTLLRKVKREKLSWTGEALSQGYFGMPINKCRLTMPKILPMFRPQRTLSSI